MERSKSLLSLNIIILLFTSTYCLADVVLAPVKVVDSPIHSGESFPESRFGSMQDDETNVMVEMRRPAGLPDVNPPALSRTGIQEVGLIAGDLGFFPKTIFVTKNIPVRIYVTGAAKKPLCFMMDSFQVKKQVRSQKVEEINVSPTEPGQYRFYCPINGMEGTMVVKDFTFREKL